MLIVIAWISFRSIHTSIDTSRVRLVLLPMHSGVSGRGEPFFSVVRHSGVPFMRACNAKLLIGSFCLALLYAPPPPALARGDPRSRAA